MSIKYLVNFGCSFAYGNAANATNQLSDKHQNTVSIMAEQLGLEEINLAHPGNCNEGIVDDFLYWIASNNKKITDASIAVFGWTTGLRYGFVSDTPSFSNKERVAKGKSQPAATAFRLGPSNAYRLKADKWTDPRWNAHVINREETARINLYRNIMAAQSHAKKFNVKSIHYHSLSMKWGIRDLSTMPYEIADKIRPLIDTKHFYQFEGDNLQDLANSDTAGYHVAYDDSHPNHICYELWANKLLEWLRDNQYFKWIKEDKTNDIQA